MAKQHYVIYLDDCSLPGFCSGGKDYFGTMDELRDFIAVLDEDGRFEETVKAFGQYLAGDTNATHYVGYCPHLLMNRAKHLAYREEYFDAKEWEFLNTYGFPYEMSFECAAVRVELLSYQGKFCRAIRVRFKNLAYLDRLCDCPRKDILGDMFLGHYGIYMVEQKGGATYMTSRLYFPEKYYKTKEEALSDFKSDICFNVCCQDVFGDG